MQIHREKKNAADEFLFHHKEFYLSSHFRPREMTKMTPQFKEHFFPYEKILLTRHT